MNLIQINSKCFNLDTLWFCSAIKEENMASLANSNLLQYAEVLESQANYVLSLLLETKYECIPSIEDAVGLNSAKYRKIYMKKKPVPFLGNNQYKRLKKPGFFNKICCKNRFKNDVFLIQMIVELEYCYRLFERELIGRFILIK